MRTMKLKKPIAHHLKKLCKNFYFISTVIFLFFVLFLDSNDIFTQVGLEKEYKTLDKERIAYQKKTATLYLKQKQLYKNKATLERIARERYLLKRPHEDMFIVEQVEQKN